MTEGVVAALVGGQYGSEGKGTIAYRLAHEYDIHVRTGAPNAGHTISHDGQIWKMRSVPCGWVNPDAKLVIGAGALVDLALLQSEVEQIEAAGYSIRERLYVDGNAGWLEPKWHELEGGVHGRAHRLIGSTGEGVGPARMARIARGVSGIPLLDGFRRVKDSLGAAAGLVVADTVPLLHTWIQEGDSVLLEGTQGSGLSLVHGPWPFVTSTDTNAAQLAADAGIAPQQVDTVILVARTFPIRVAGNSGPLHRETSWRVVGVPEERTTVTLKTRRVGLWDQPLIDRACLLNRPDQFALTFLDYLYPRVTGAKSWEEIRERDPAAERFVAALEARLNVPITMVGTGGPEFSVAFGGVADRTMMRLHEDHEAMLEKLAGAGQ